MAVTHLPAGPTRWYRQPGIVLVAAAAGWGGLLLVLAFVLPVESDNQGEPIKGAPGWTSYPKRPLVHVNGLSVLWIVAIPLITCLLVGGLLVLHQRSGWAPAWMLSITLSGLLVLAGVVGTVTILVGILVIPSGVLLVCACLASRLPRARPSGL